jgi:hypothetical protein
MKERTLLEQGNRASEAQRGWMLYLYDVIVGIANFAAETENGTGNGARQCNPV